jgi:hypothetical protein
MRTIWFCPIIPATWNNFIGSEVFFDEPFSFGSLYSAPFACHWPAQLIAADALSNVAQIRTVFPHGIVGDIEPVPNLTGSPDWLNRLRGIP